MNEWIQVGMKVVNYWFEDEAFEVTALEEYDPDNPHENVWVKDTQGHTRYFDETTLEMA